MHQSFETPAPPPPQFGPQRGIGGALTLDTLLVGSLVGGEFAESHGLRIPYRGNKRGSHSWSAVFIFAPDSNFAYIIVDCLLLTRSWIPD